MKNPYQPTAELPVSKEPNNRDIAEQESIRLAQDGDAAAFEQLYRRYSSRIYRLCFHMVKNEADAEDLTQEAFLRVFRKRKLTEISLENNDDHEEEPFSCLANGSH